MKVRLVGDVFVPPGPAVCLHDIMEQLQRGIFSPRQSVRHLQNEPWNVACARLDDTQLSESSLFCSKSIGLR